MLIDSFQRFPFFLIRCVRWQRLGIAIAHFLFYLQATNNNKIYKR